MKALGSIPGQKKKRQKNKTKTQNKATSHFTQAEKGTEHLRTKEGR
jgi:hypothetical protein